MTPQELEGMTKDQVMEELDAREIIYNKRAKLEKLKELLIEKGSSNSNTVESVKNVKWLKNPDTGIVFEATPALLRLGTLTPVDSKEG